MEGLSALHALHVRPRMKILWTAYLTSFLLVACGADDNYSVVDPFLLELPKDAQNHGMPDGFVEEFTDSYLAEVTPGIARIRSSTPPIRQDLEIWNLRALFYTNLWGEHGVDMHYLPILTEEEFESLRLKVLELRTSNELLEIENVELKARIHQLEAGEQNAAGQPATRSQSK